MTCRFCGEWTYKAVTYSTRHSVCFDCIKSKWTRKMVLERLHPWQITGRVPYKVLEEIGFTRGELREMLKT